MGRPHLGTSVIRSLPTEQTGRQAKAEEAAEEKRPRPLDFVRPLAEGSQVKWEA